jgi:hypothetical protein
MLSEGRPGIDNVFSLRDGKASVSTFPALDFNHSPSQVS